MKKILLLLAFCSGWVSGGDGLPSILADLHFKWRTDFDYLDLDYITGRSSESDQRLYNYLSITTKDMGIKNLKTYVALRYDSDLDGVPQDSEFRNTLNFKNADQFRLYYAYADYHIRRNSSRYAARVGRQSANDAEMVYFDGLRLDLSFFHEKLGLDYYIGQRFTHYSNPKVEDVYGGSLTINPWSSTHFRYSYLSYIERSSEFFLDQTFGLNLLASARFAMVNTDPRDFMADVSWFGDKTGTTMFLSYYQKFGETYHDFDYDYTSTDLSGDNLAVRRLLIKDLEPFYDLSLKLEQAIYKGLTLTAEYLTRELEYADLQDQYNYPFHQWAMGLSATGFLVPKSQVRVNYRRWEADHLALEPGVPFDQVASEGDTNYEEFSGEASMRFKWRLTLGLRTWYRVYDYQNRFVLVDDANSLSVGGYGSWQFHEKGRIALNYGREDDFLFINPNLKSVKRLRVQFQLRF